MSGSEAIVPVMVAPEVTPEPETKTKMVRNRDGSYREVVFKGGKFSKKVDRREISEDQAKALARREAKNKDWWMKILTAQARLAQNVDDPEFATASTKAAEFMRAFMYGKLSLSDADKAAREHDGIKVVVVTQPPVQEGVDHTKIKKAEQPSWITAEAISTNEPPKAY